MATPTVENYVKQMFLEQQRSTERLVPLGKLAALMGVVPGTATTMVKALADSGLVRYEPRNGARLTRSGEKLALHVLRRHRLLELFLVKVLSLDWSEVHEEAEVLEHAISEKVLERIDRLLGHPTTDPHGDLIPDAEGAFVARKSQSLAECHVGQQVRVACVESDDKEFLKFAEGHGLIPGKKVIIERVSAIADALTIRPHGCDSVVIGTNAAARIQVDSPPAARSN
jgi:DtxR family Mn-dependent transcriptional regulator